MPIPAFVADLRRFVGSAPLWLSGVTALVLDRPRGRVLLVQRADNGQWTPITGIVDPGEHPARTAVREAQEEADVEVEPVRLVSVDVVGPVTHTNGDVASYLDLAFECVHVSGEPSPADGENTSVRWFPIDDHPPMNERFTALLALALEDRPEAAFRC